MSQSNCICLCRSGRSGDTSGDPGDPGDPGTDPGTPSDPGTPYLILTQKCTEQAGDFQVLHHKINLTYNYNIITM